MNVILYMWMVLHVWAVSVLIHEAGHMMMYRHIVGTWPELKWSRGSLCMDCPTLNNKEYLRVLYAGITFGAIVGYFVLAIISIFTVMPGILYYTALLMIYAGYFAGCKHDIKEIIKINKRIKEA